MGIQQVYTTKTNQCSKIHAVSTVHKKRIIRTHTREPYGSNSNKYNK